MNRKDSTLNGKLHGESRLFYNDGSPLNICHYDNDRFHGESMWWYKSGAIHKREKYVHGKPVYTIRYYDNGNKHIERLYDEHRGLIYEKVWYKSGDTESISEYKEDKLHTTVFNERGEIKVEIKGSNKILSYNDGEYKYYKDGKVISCLTYRLGKLHGKCLLNGKTSYYNNDVLVSQEYHKVLSLLNLKSNVYKQYSLLHQNDFWRKYCGENGIGRKVDEDRMLSVMC